MRIFIGSAQESLALVREVEVWLEDQKFEAIPWDMPGLFLPGSSTLHRLIEISKTMADAAIFIFSEDDKVWYRSDTLTQPRDNVLIEYGLFVGSLGAHKAVIFRNGNPKAAADINGITCIDISEKRRKRGRIECNIWCQNLTREKSDPILLPFQAKILQLERDKNEIQNRLRFEIEKAKELSDIITETGIINFNNYDVNTDGHWKLLFSFDYVLHVSMVIEDIFTDPKSFFQHLTDLKSFTNENWNISIEHPKDLNRFTFYIRKALRVFRMQHTPESYRDFIKSLGENRNKLDDIANSILASQKH